MSLGKKSATATLLAVEAARHSMLASDTLRTSAYEGAEADAGILNEINFRAWEEQKEATGCFYDAMRNGADPETVQKILGDGPGVREFLAYHFSKAR